VPLPFTEQHHSINLHPHLYQTLHNPTCFNQVTPLPPSHLQFHINSTSENQSPETAGVSSARSPFITTIYNHNLPNFILNNSRNQIQTINQP
jgi:hypothetical protein